MGLDRLPYAHTCIPKHPRAKQANVNAKDKDGTTALMAAAVRGHKEVLESLIKHTADVNAQNSDGHTALFFAYNGLNQVSTL